MLHDCPILSLRTLPHATVPYCAMWLRFRTSSDVEGTHSATWCGDHPRKWRAGTCDDRSETLGTLKRERWRDSNMSRPQWKCNWATHAMDMPRRMSKSLSELGCQVLDLYRCFIMRKIQLYWRISPFDRNTLIETFLNVLVAQNQNQVYGKSHGKSVNMLAINNHVKLTKECLLPEDLAGFLPPLPRNLGRWSKVLVVNVVLTFVFSLLAYSSMAIH